MITLGTRRHPLPALLLRITGVLAFSLLVAFGGEPLRAREPDTISVVRGRVVEHDTGEPVSGAAVSLAAGPGGTRGIGTRVTSQEGVFVFNKVPPGTYRIRVTHLGFSPLQDTLQVRAATELDVTLSLTVSPVELEPLVVVSRRRPSGLMGDFELRRRTRSGTFFNRQEIEERHPHVFTDLLRLVPGARVLPVGPNRFTVRLRGGCQPTLWVDGFKLMTTEEMDAILPTMDLEAVEVYHGASVPGRFPSNGCGAVVVWTRRGEPMAAQGSLWKRLAVAAGFILLGWVLVG